MPHDDCKGREADAPCLVYFDQVETKDTLPTNIAYKQNTDLHRRAQHSTEYTYHARNPYQPLYNEKRSKESLHQSNIFSKLTFRNSRNADRDIIFRALMNFPCSCASFDFNLAITDTLHAVSFPFIFGQRSNVMSESGFDFGDEKLFQFQFRLS